MILRYFPVRTNTTWESGDRFRTLKPATGRRFFRDVASGSPPKLSWKATSYVKEITEGISHSEKLLLFVLADYHNTAKQVAWPSMSVLAEEALMSERSASRLLARLESKGIVSRIVPKGGNRTTTLYSFPALDSGRQNVAPRDDVRDDKISLSGRQLGRQTESCNKEEPVLTGEPVKACNRCSGFKFLKNPPHQKPHLVGCPECNPENVAGIRGVGI